MTSMKMSDQLVTYFQCCGKLSSKNLGYITVEVEQITKGIKTIPRDNSTILDLRFGKPPPL